MYRVCACLIPMAISSAGFGRPASHVLCVAHVTNTMGVSGDDFEKGEADGMQDALAVLASAVSALLTTTDAA
jgi:hypothetical protein